MALFRPGQTTGTSSFAGTASYAENAGTASFVTASNVWGPFGSSSIESASYAQTASYALNAGTPGGSDTQIQFNSGSEFSGSTNFTFDYVNNITYLTGSSWVSGSMTLTGSMYVSGAISASFGNNTVGFYGTASWAVSASRAVTASYAVVAGGLVAGAAVPAALPEYSIQFNSGSQLAGTGSYLFKYLSQSVEHGSQSFALGQYSHAQGIGALTGLRGITPDYVAGGVIEFHDNINYSDALQPSAVGSLWVYKASTNTVSKVSYYATVNAPPTFSIYTLEFTLSEATIVVDTQKRLPNYLDENATFPLLQGVAAHAQGVDTFAYGRGSHAEGWLTTAENTASHAEGYATTATGQYSHAEGYNTNARGLGSHAEGVNSTTDPTAQYAHVEGIATYALGNYSHAEGKSSLSYGESSHAEGESTQTQASAVASHTEGLKTLAYANYSHGEGMLTTTYQQGSHAEGSGSLTGTAGVQGQYYDISPDGYVTISGNLSGDFIVGDYVVFDDEEAALGVRYFEIYQVTVVAGPVTEVYLRGAGGGSNGSRIRIARFNEPGVIKGVAGIAYKNSWGHAEGKATAIIGTASHAEGYGSTAYGEYSHAEGEYTGTFIKGSHSEGYGTRAFGQYSHVEGKATITLGPFAHAEGDQTKAIGTGSHTEGVNTIASHSYAHAEGVATNAFNTGSHTEGWYTTTLGLGSHAEGYTTAASGNYSHTEGYNTIAGGSGSHAEGYYTIATGSYSHAEGSSSIARGDGSHAEGNYALAFGIFAHAEGGFTTASGNYSHAEGVSSLSLGTGSHAEGYFTTASSNYSHAEGISNVITGEGSHAEGLYTTASGNHAHTEGIGTQAAGSGSHAEGQYTTASGNYSHAEGVSTWANTTGAHSEGGYTTASGQYSHAEGRGTIASAEGAHSEGYFTTASNNYSHAEGNYTWAAAEGSHAEGSETTASGDYSHAEGQLSYAVGYWSHAGGLHTIAFKNHSTTIGQYNIDNNNDDMFVIGDGADDANRHDLLNASVGYIRITGSAIVSSSLNVIGISNVTGSNNITGSWDLKGDGHVTGSFDITGSYDLKGIGTVTGSLDITGSYGLKGEGAVTGSFMITGSLVADYASLTGSLTGSFIGTGSGFFDGFFTGSLTGSFIGTGSGFFDGLFTGSNPNGVSFYGTSSWAVSASIAETASFVTGSIFTGTNVAATASLALNNITTASIAANVITFTKGDGSTFPITVDTGSADITEVIAGIGLDGGGTSGAVTIDINYSDVSASMAGYGFSYGDITGVAAGTGMTGGGTSGDVTLNVDYLAVSGAMAGYGFGSGGGGGGGGDITDVNAGDGILVDNSSGPAPTVKLDTGSAHFIAGVSNLTGSLLTTTSFNNWTGSNSSQFAGTASYVTGSIFSGNNLALSASYSVTSSFTETASFAQTASAINVTLSSNVDERLPVILAYTSSNTGAKLAYIDAGFDYNTLTNALYVPGNGAYIVGNTTLQSSIATFGSAGNPNHVVLITGSLNVSKSVNVDGTVTAGFGPDTVGFVGTASWAVSASQALTASFVSGAFMQGGNSFATGAVLGTNDLQDLSLETNGTTRMFISSSGMIWIGGQTTQQFSGTNATIQLYAGASVNNSVGIRSSQLLLYPPGSNTTASILFGTNGLAGWTLRNQGMPIFQIRSTPGGGTFTTVMQFSSGSDGQYRVGVMTEDPQHTFDVSGSARITGSFYLPGVTSSPYNNVLIIDTGSGQVYVTASSAIGGGGGPTTPGGPLRSIQFNSASVLSGSSNFTFNEVDNTVTLTGSFLVTQSYISTIDYIDFRLVELGAEPAHNEGRLHWYNDTKTLQIDTDKNGFMIEVGHQNVVRVFNDTGVTIPSGSVVRIQGAQGNQPKIVTASWEDDSSSAATLGFTAVDINSGGGNQHGYVVTNGILRNVNTSAYTVGTQLYLSSSGQFTDTPPDAPLHEVRLGKVVLQNATTGVIYVDVMNGYELTELHDVKTTTYSDGDLLVQSSSLWINSKQLTGSYGLTGSLTAIDGGFTGSLFGTASYVTGSLFTNTNPALSASYALTASYAANAIVYNSNEGVFQSGTTFKLGDNSSVGAYNLIPFTEDRYIDFGNDNNSLFFTKQSSFLFKLSGSGQLMLNQYTTSTKFQGSSGASIGVLHTDNTGRIFVSSSGTSFTYNSTSSVIGDGVATSFNINHGFNTRNLHITVYESGSNGETVYPDIRRINDNTASIIFANPPTSLQYIVYVSQ